MKQRFRILILCVMLIFSAACGLMIPHININSDLTRYLPADSRMREGLDSLKVEFPYIDTNAPSIKAMFRKGEDPDSLSQSIVLRYGLSSLLSTRENDSLLLFDFTAPKDCPLEVTAAAIKAEHSDCVEVETNANSNMPSNMVTILLIAAILIFIILFVMCQSFMEALLFIFTIGLAVVMNMGTNALLPSVSMMTNTIVGVLQFVLSMDYSIILMNRYRMVKAETEDSSAAMNKSLRLASSSILSSSLTTIVGLLVLVFMKFRIGMDLGIVLAKGVFFSLISIYTILPALILIFEKAIEASKKKVPLIPTDKLSSLEVKYRWVLFPIFVGLFISSFILQQKTELSYASVWESKIAEIFPAQNSFMLLFPTQKEDAFPALADSISTDPKVVTAVSYSSIMRRKLTAPEMFNSIFQLSALMPSGASLPVDSTLLTESNLEILYYAATHPERTEKMSFNDIIALTSDKSVMSMIPAGFDPKAMASRFTPKPKAKIKKEEKPSETQVVIDSLQKDNILPQADTAVTVQAADSTAPAPRFNYEQLNSQMSYSELAQYMDSGESNTKLIFRMAGRKGRTMSPAEFISYVNEKILPNRLLRAAISEDQIEGLKSVSKEIDAVLAAGPEIAQTPDSITLYSTVKDSVVLADISTGLVAEHETVSKPLESPSAAVLSVPEEPDTPFDIITDMYLSGRKYSAGQISKAINNAGIDIPESAIDLMFLYYGCKTSYDKNTALSVEELVDFLCDRVAGDETFSLFLSGEAREGLKGLRGLIDGSIGQLRGKNWSMAAIVTDYSVESDETFDFVERVKTLGAKTFGENYYFIGEPVMYKEMKDGFRKELLYLTFLTIIAIFIIVALTFKSLVIPVILIMSVLTGVFVNVFASGLGGGKMLYLAYLIVQSILMGATIDYGILLTNFYRDSRRAGIEKVNAMKFAYKSSIHTIMTSGLIMVAAPYVMSLALPDPTISSILSSLTFGALSAILVILFLLPAALVACDKLIVKNKK